MLTSIIFDIDGTIIDNETAILKSLQATLKEEGMEYELADLRFALGIPGKESLRKLNIQDIDNVHAKWSEKERQFTRQSEVFKGLEGVIAAIAQSDLNIGIVTSKTRYDYDTQFSKMPVSSHFDIAVVVEDTAHHKPHPEPLLLCLEKLGASGQEAIYIGDSIYDNQCAKNAGAQFGLAYWGSKTKEGYHPDFVFKEPGDILDMLKKYNLL
ncbi:HAD family hydrolase [Bacillus sp. 1P06AnD]|uniref:HAD family hydrolase n=1 Tax=Bacillus sp. 1P06AnD TaxID=3132208 RepID=UPI00399F957F